MGFRGAIFEVDGVLVDSPHLRAWREALRELMENEWSEIRPQTSYAPEKFTPEVHQRVRSGKPRYAGAQAALEYFDVPDAQRRARVNRGDPAPESTRAVDDPGRSSTSAGSV